MEPHFKRETFKVDAEQLVTRFKQLVHAGNVRRVVIRQGDHVVVEFPLTVGVVGVMLAPMLAAVGALAAVLTECTIEIERVDTTSDGTGGTPAGEPSDAATGVSER